MTPLELKALSQVEAELKIVEQLLHRYSNDATPLGAIHQDGPAAEMNNRLTSASSWNSAVLKESSMSGLQLKALKQVEMEINTVQDLLTKHTSSGSTYLGKSYENGTPTAEMLKHLSTATSWISAIKAET